jgi:two-component system, sensor histidine kinase PdtaS
VFSAIYCPNGCGSLPVGYAGRSVLMLHPAGKMSELFPQDEPTAVPRAATNLATDLDERLRQQRAVAEFSRFALAAPSISDLLDEAARHAADGLGAPLSKVLEYLPAEDVLLVRAGVGWRDGIVGTARLGTDTASPAGYALKTGRPVLSNHLAAEARFRSPALLAEHGVRRAINVVVRGEGEPFGVLEADRRDPGEFSGQDIGFLQCLANTLGLAIDRERERAAREVLLVEKEMLVQEAHHRVKNSLQLVQAVTSTVICTDSNSV